MNTVAECIPFKTFKERLKIVKEELSKNRHVEIWDKHIYSAEKWRRYDERNSRNVSN